MKEASRVVIAGKHVIGTEPTPNGHIATCSCGKFVLGFFASPERAKRAMMNCSHPDDRKEKS